MTDARIHSTLRRASLVLFDFDGPICDVFAGLSAADVARQLERHLASKIKTDDPLRILQEAVKYGSGTVRKVEDELIAAELRAVDQSVTTPGGLESMTEAANQGKMVGILSNNSAQSITRFFERIRFLPKITPVVGRAYARPDLMKPNPHTFRSALEEVRQDAHATVFIGDSTTDIEVAHAVGAAVIGYANKPGKADAFAAAGATLIVDDMHDICAALTSHAH